MSTIEQDRFWAKVDHRGSDDCWLWTAGRVDGYGFFASSAGSKRAHRIAYEWLIGPVPPGLQLDHLCRNRACVNPAHLEPVTNRENVLRGVGVTARNARKTHCKRGHPLTGDNVYVRPPNGRACRTCKVLQDAEWHRANAERRVGNA